MPAPTLDGPHGRLSCLDRAGHAPRRQAPAAITARLADFLAGL